MKQLLRLQPAMALAVDDNKEVEMRFSGINAVITGGASGLGLAVAKAVVAEGGMVTIGDINATQGEKAAAELGTAAQFLPTDVTKEEQVESLVSQAAQKAPVGLAVACAGILGNKRVLGRDGVMPTDFFSQVIQVNLIGTFNLNKYAAAQMEKNNPGVDGERGVVVNTASIAAFEGQIGQAAYSASKGAIAGMTLPLAREFARVGVRVLTIAPGIFLTPMMASLPQEIQESLASMVPFPSRLGNPEEYAQTVRFLTETTMMNGEIIRLDGAIRMQPK